ncbi:MAG: hydrogenase maturation nickel metallochaperone HypA [Ferruginibacter sp.]
MHELSIVMSVIDIARKEAEKANSAIIEEIEMDIGCLSTVDLDAFEFAWQLGVKETILEGAAIKINRIKGKATCIACETSFPLENFYDACPACGKHAINIIEGKELRVKSLILS